jgi:SAM-dependent methyltransferase
MKAKYLVNSLLFPLRVITPQRYLNSLGLNTLADDRVEAVLPYVSGFILDVGCGENLLVKRWGEGVGVDIMAWPGVDVVCDTAKLPFRDIRFDVITFLACLNHIPNREIVLKEAQRVLKPGGKVIVTMIGPIAGYLCHKLIAHWDPDQVEREMDHKEEWGLDDSKVKALIESAGFEDVGVKRFGFMRLNRLYEAVKPSFWDT